jgi:hypothetical protein
VIATPLDDFEKHIAAIALNKGLQEEPRGPVRGNRPIDQDTPRTKRFNVQPMPG